LRGIKRMKIGVGDPDVPGNEAVRSDLNLLFRHDKRAVKQSEIADRTLAVFTDRKRAAGITGNMLADNYCTRFPAAKFPEDLRALTVKSFAELDVAWNRMRPPIVLDMSIRFDVAHEGNFPEV
jgi:hypothetical protein